LLCLPLGSLIPFKKCYNLAHRLTLYLTHSGSNYVQGALNWGPNPALNAVEKTYSWWTDRRVPFTAGWHTYTLEWTERCVLRFLPLLSNENSVVTNHIATTSWLRISVDSRLHTLLDIRFNQPFWKRGQFPETTLDANGKAEALKDPWTAGVPGVNGTGGNAAPFDQGERALLL
jgi:hypothetical protein